MNVLRGVPPGERGAPRRHTALVYALARRLAGRGAAVLAGVLFGFHAGSHEGAYWVAARFDLLATFGGLLAVLLLTSGGAGRCAAGVAAFAFARSPRSPPPLCRLSSRLAAQALAVASDCPPAGITNLLRVVERDATIEIERPSPATVDLYVPAYAGQFVASRDLRRYDVEIPSGETMAIETRSAGSTVGPRVRASGFA